VSELVLKYRKWPIEPASEVRSTLIMAGIQTLRAQGLAARYSQILSPSQREHILGLAAGIWVPVELAIEHYTAMDRLAVDRVTTESMGADVAARTWKHILAPTFAHATRDGWRPWEALLDAHAAIDRTWHGTDVQIVKEGPTQARYEWAGQPCAAIPYFVTSFGAFMRALIKLFSRRAYYDVAPEHCSSTTVAIRLSWIELSENRRASMHRSLSSGLQERIEVAAASGARWSTGARGRA
jgi:hypothetical protein